MSSIPAAPSLRALERGREVLAALSAARTAYALYPPRHPNLVAARTELIGLMRAFWAASTGDPVLFVARHSIYVGPLLLARESLAMFRLIEAFETAGIATLEITRTVGDEDAEYLLRRLDGQHPPAPDSHGLLYDRVTPRLVLDGDRDLEMTELRRAYAVGLETLRDVAVRVTAGQAIDLDIATATVEQLADRVMADPSHALLLTTVKSFDEYTYYHMVNVCLLSIALGQAIGLRRDQVTTLGLGALLHDVGKVNISRDILQHVGSLSEEQWRIVQKHPVDGAGLVLSTGEGLYHPAATVVLEHHAAYDLSGYPALTQRPHPSLPSRLVSVVDCFDAVTSRRAYRSPAQRRDALEILEAGAGHGFDPKVVRVFLTLLGLFPVGSLVQLESGEVALVVRNHERLLARPTVMVVLDAGGNVADLEERDLSLTDGRDRYRWTVSRTLDAATLGIDVVDLLATGDLSSATLAASADARRHDGDEEAGGDDEAGEGPGGLVHEPSFGEPVPEGYVDTHNQPGSHHHIDPADGRLDPEVSAPTEE